jgi:hypothetical protein
VLLAVAVQALHEGVVGGVEEDTALLVGVEVEVAEGSS